MMTRRTFSGALLAASQARAAGKPKAGACSWCFHNFAPGADPAQAIDILGEMGFDGLDLIMLAPEDIKDFWTAPKIDQLKVQLAKHKLEVAQYVLFQPVVAGLTSLDRSERDRNLDNFEAGCKVGKAFGAPILNIVAPWPRELKGPTDYLPRYYDIAQPKPGEKFHIDVAAGFDWDRVWQAYVDTTKACLQRAKAHGMKLSIEHHTHTMVPDAASFLRLADAVKDPALGYNLDTGWTMSHRDYPPVAIHKTSRHLMNIHVRDVDGMMRRFVHIGEGVMDFRAIADAVKSVGYTGYLTLEQDKHPGDMRETCRRYLKMMREYLA